MKYTEFIKENYAKVKHLPQKERFAKLAQMWHASKGKGSKGAGLFSDIAHGVGSAAEMFGLGLPKLEKKKRMSKKEKGGMLSAGGLPEKRMRKSKGGVLTAGGLDTGAGFLSSTLGALGL